MRWAWPLALALTASLAPASDLRVDPRDLDALPLHRADATAIAAAVADADMVKGFGPTLFAVTAPLNLTLADGRWDAPASGRQRWRLRVHSADARSLLLYFSRFNLPEGAALWIYDAQGRTVRGPYTSANGIADGTLWTAMVPGDTAVVELQVDDAQRDRVELALARVGHAYKNTAQLGDAGACNIDVACPLGNDWRNEVRSTVKLQIPVSFGLFVGLCTGTLVNNTAQDDRPFVLTANHCGIGSLGSPASGVVTYWNFQNSGCNVVNATDAQTQSGATLRASDRGTDLALIELDQHPDAAFGVYYAGWDATSGTGARRGVSLHHPSGDAKKISQFSTPLSPSTVQLGPLGPNVPAWKVQWSLGATETGSSGAGLWNENRQIVGVLSGGNSACSGNVGNGQPDYYARLDHQWLASSQPSGQLKAWLDPIDSGCRAVGGKNPGNAAAVSCDAGSGGGGGGALNVAALLVLLGALSARRASRA
ncbi:trypsin-like peptidase domain-containing protein [Fontimonas sp. SYSU GA230001]|uniref:trypsin-like serine peptidase n=1 Tax=Fontimonas sp. SYSU GA230001 TaxID=3142450 RepID=UPI0032B5B1B9